MVSGDAGSQGQRQVDKNRGSELQRVRGKNKRAFEDMSKGKQVRKRVEER